MGLVEWQYSRPVIYGVGYEVTITFRTAWLRIKLTSNPGAGVAIPLHLTTRLLEKVSPKEAEPWPAVTQCYVRTTWYKRLCKIRQVLRLWPTSQQIPHRIPCLFVTGSPSLVAETRDMGHFPPPPRGRPSRAPVRHCVSGRPLRLMTGGSFKPSYRSRL